MNGDDKDKKALVPVQPALIGDVAAATEHEKNPVLSYLGGLDAKTSRRTMGAALDIVAEIVTGTTKPIVPVRGQTKPGLFAAAMPGAFVSIRFEHARRVQREAIKRFQPRTVRKVLAAMRGVLREAFRLGLITDDDYQRAIALPKVRLNRTAPRGRMLTREEIDALFAAARDERDRVALYVLMAGLRRDEIELLTVGDVKAGTLHVHGKGGKERDVPLDAEMSAALEKYASGRPPSASLIERSGEWVYLRAKELGKKAGLAALSPHDFRRTLASRLLDRGLTAEAKQILGHANVSTTLMYDRRGEKAAKAAMTDVWKDKK